MEPQPEIYEHIHEYLHGLFDKDPQAEVPNPAKALQNRLPSMYAASTAKKGKAVEVGSEAADADARTRDEFPEFDDQDDDMGQQP